MLLAKTLNKVLRIPSTTYSLSQNISWFQRSFQTETNASESRLDNQLKVFDKDQFLQQQMLEEDESISKRLNQIFSKIQKSNEKRILQSNAKIDLLASTTNNTIATITTTTTTTAATPFSSSTSDISIDKPLTNAQGNNMRKENTTTDNEEKIQEKDIEEVQNINIIENLDKQKSIQTEKDSPSLHTTKIRKKNHKDDIEEKQILQDDSIDTTVTLIDKNNRHIISTNDQNDDNFTEFDSNSTISIASDTIQNKNLHKKSKMIIEKSPSLQEITKLDNVKKPIYTIPFPDTLAYFGPNLYYLLRLTNSSGVYEYDIPMYWEQHYGQEYHYKVATIAKFLIAKYSHRFIVDTNSMGHRMLRPRLLHHNETFDQTNPSHKHQTVCNLEKLSKKQLRELWYPVFFPTQKKEPLSIPLSKLQDAFINTYNHLSSTPRYRYFICNNLYKLIHQTYFFSCLQIPNKNNNNKFAIIDEVDYYVTWNIKQDTLYYTDEVFKIFHLLSNQEKNCNIMSYHQLYDDYVSLYGQMFLCNPQQLILLIKRQLQVYGCSFFTLMDTKMLNSNLIYVSTAHPTSFARQLVYMKVMEPPSKSTLSLKKNLAEVFQKININFSNKRLDVHIKSLRGKTLMDNYTHYLICFRRSNQQKQFLNYIQKLKSRQNNNIPLEWLRYTEFEKWNLRKLSKFLRCMIPTLSPYFPKQMTWLKKPKQKFIPISSQINQDRLKIDNKLINTKSMELNENKIKDENINQMTTEKNNYSSFTLKSDSDLSSSSDINFNSMYIIEIAAKSESEYKQSQLEYIQFVLSDLWSFLLGFPDGVIEEHLKEMYWRHTRTMSGQSKDDCVKFLDNFVFNVQEQWNNSNKMSDYGYSPGWMFSKKTSDKEIKWFHQSYLKMTKQTLSIWSTPSMDIKLLKKALPKIYRAHILGITPTRLHTLIHFDSEEVANEIYSAIKSNTIVGKNGEKVDCSRHIFKMHPTLERYSHFRFNKSLFDEISRIIQREREWGIAIDNLIRKLKAGEYLPNEVKSTTDLCHMLMNVYPHQFMITSMMMYGNKRIFVRLRKQPYPNLKIHSLNENSERLFERYEQDWCTLFLEHFKDSGLLLSQTHDTFYRYFGYVPPLQQSTVTWLKKFDIFAFRFYEQVNPSNTNNKIDEDNSKVSRLRSPDLLLLWMQQRTEEEIQYYRYPKDGLVLDGFPWNTNTKQLNMELNEYYGACQVLRRGPHRFVLWFKDETTAARAQSIFRSPEVQAEGIRIIRKFMLYSPQSHLRFVPTTIDEKLLYL